MGAMTLSATREWDFSSEQGKANYKAAQRRYPAQAIVDLAALRDNMRHLVSVVGGPHSGTAVMGIVKADARSRTSGTVQMEFRGISFLFLSDSCRRLHK